jgi:2-C-methyl-D-erythritol 4-phosphate cytidylyltransferase
MNFAVILAAGKGKRFGKEKQFVLIKNKPVIYYSILKFNKSPIVQKIIIVVSKDRVHYLKNMIKKYNLSKVSSVIVGGIARQDSMRNALELLPEKGYVVIHDAARPLFSKTLIRQGFNFAEKFQTCIPVIPIQDTIKKVKNSIVIKTINRSDLYCIQTPQFYEIRLLKKAYNKACQVNYYATDDANLVEQVGFKVHTIPGQKQNIKITDTEDLELIKALI